LLVFCAAGGIILLKLVVVTPLTRAFGLNWANGLRTGLLLGPGGEFAFVIVSVASGEHLLAPDAASAVLFVTALTMATIPLLSRLGGRLAPRFARWRGLEPGIKCERRSTRKPLVVCVGVEANGKVLPKYHTVLFLRPCFGYSIHLLSSRIIFGYQLTGVGGTLTFDPLLA
jgi:hypothetical protein